jgi:hypothetical protein
MIIYATRDFKNNIYPLSVCCTAQSASRWSLGSSNSKLVFSNGGRTVRRPGNISSYPLAVVPVPALRSSVNLVIDACPFVSNSLSFGVSKAGAVGESGSDGVGPSKNSWGVICTYPAGPATPYASGTKLTPTCRRFAVGDVLKASLDLLSRALRLSLNDTEFSIDIDVPEGVASGYVFALTLASDLEVLLVGDNSHSVPSATLSALQVAPLEDGSQVVRSFLWTSLFLKLSKMRASTHQVHYSR